MVYYQCCSLIGWATTRLYVIASKYRKAQAFWRQKRIKVWQNFFYSRYFWPTSWILQNDCRGYTEIWSFFRKNLNQHKFFKNSVQKQLNNLACVMRIVSKFTSLSVISKVSHPLIDCVKGNSNSIRINCFFWLWQWITKTQGNKRHRKVNCMYITNINSWKSWFSYMGKFFFLLTLLSNSELHCKCINIEKYP